MYVSRMVRTGPTDIMETGIYIFSILVTSCV